MKQKIALIVSMLCCTVLSMAQVQKFQIGAQSNSIVRSVKGDSVLVYSEVSPSEAYFLLYVDGDASAQAFQLLPGYNVQVRDVRIRDGKTAYFCGTKGTGIFFNNQAVVGQFDINDVFSGTGTVQWAYFPWVDINANGMYLTDMTRLDLFEYNGTVCMAMAGKTVYDMGTWLPGTTVASAWYDGTTWHMIAHTNRYLKMKFTDVACLDEMILSVGTTEEDTGCLVKPFYKAPDFPNHPINADAVTGLSFGSPVGEVLVDSVSHNSAVIAHFDKPSGAGVVFHLVNMSSTGIPLGTVKTWLAPPSSTSVYGTGQKLYELNSVGGKAYLLHANEYPATSYPTPSDWLLELDYSNYPPSSGYAVYTPLKMWRPQYGDMHSMDASVTSIRLSGVDGTRLMTYGPYHPKETVCYDIDSLDVLYENAGIYESNIVDNASYFQVLPDSGSPVIFKIEVNTICILKGKEDKQ